MKKLFNIGLLSLLACSLVALSGCYKKDIDDLEDRLNQQEVRLTTLEEAVKVLEDQIKAGALIQKIETIAGNAEFPQGGHRIIFTGGTPRSIDLMNGTHGKTPVIGTTSDATGVYITVDGVKQNINIKGPDGTPAAQPSIGANGNWFIGTTDTGVKAAGTDADQPSIGANGNWFIGTTDTGVKAAGTDAFVEFRVADVSGVKTIQYNTVAAPSTAVWTDLLPIGNVGPVAMIAENPDGSVTITMNDGDPTATPAVEPTTFTFAKYIELPSGLAVVKSVNNGDGTIAVTFRTNPSTATLPTNATWEADLLGTRASYVTAAPFTVAVAADGEKQGQYIATLTVGDGYDGSLTYTLALVMTVGEASVSSAAFDVPAVGAEAVAEALLAAAANGGEFTLTADVTIDNSIDRIKVEQGKELIVNLNGKSISRVSGTWMFYSEGTLTINGPGEITNHDGNAVTVGPNGAITINGGTYTGGSEVIYAYGGTTSSGSSGTGTITIKDGYFKAQETFDPGVDDRYFVLNLKDNGGSTISVEGGTFENFNPAAALTEPGYTTTPYNFVAEGFKSVKKADTPDPNGTYEVVPMEEGDYATAAAAQDALDNGATEINMVAPLAADAEFTLGNSYTADQEVTIDIPAAAGKNIVINQPATGDMPKLVLNVEDANDVTINAPEGSVEVSGTINGTLTASTAPATLTILADAEVEELVVEQGNVVVLGKVNSYGEIAEGSKIIFPVATPAELNAALAGVFPATNGVLQLTANLTYPTQDKTVAITIPAELNMTIDLNGCNIETNGIAQHVIRNYGTLLIIGDGMVKGNDADMEAYQGAIAVWADGRQGAGNVTIDGGSYTSALSSCLYTLGGATMTINGGEFAALHVPSYAPNTDFHYVCNQYNGNQSIAAGGAFFVMGGTFHGYNPAWGDDNLGGNFVPESYVSTETGEGTKIWVVSRE